MIVQSVAADEAALIERARSDPDALGELYDRHVQRIYWLAYRLSGNHADAEDLTARTFQRALEALPGYEWRGVPFGAWLARICRNLATDGFRRSRPSLSLDLLSANGFEPAAELEGAGAALIERETLDAAWQAVARLPELQRRAVTLYFGQELPHAEVGRRIGRSEAATKQLVYRAVQSLRGWLAEPEGGN